MIFTGIPIGVLIDWLANKYGLPTQDGMSPVPWAILGLVWPNTLKSIGSGLIDKNKKRNRI